MTNPNDLSSTQKTCPADCPFLSPRNFLPEFLPFYCDKYEEFLGAVPSKKTKRCDVCRRKMLNIQEAGVSLIEAYTAPLISIPETQQAFLEMNGGFQRMFVELLRKVGRQVGLNFGESAGIDVLSDKLLIGWKDAQDLAGSPELKEFKGVLGDLASSSPDLLTRQTQNLLSNLFQVLDKSERMMLKSVLQNPKQVESFLQEFARTPKDMSLLKNFRGLLYDYDKKDRAHQQQEREQMMRLQRDRLLNQRNNRVR